MSHGSDDTPQLRKLAGEGLTKGRVEALTDGILAVAMTILVLDIKIQANDSILTDAHLLRHLLDVERTFSVYIVSFVVLGMNWVAHTVQFHYVKRVDRFMLWGNLLFMLLVTLVPFTTNLLITYDALLLPNVIYSVNQLLLATALLLNINYLSRNMHLADAALTPQIVAFIHRRLLLAAAIPVLAIAVAFVNARVSLYVYLLMLLAHIFPREIDSRMRHWSGKGKP